RGTRHCVGRLDSESQLRRGAGSDVERGAGYCGEPTGARRQRVARPGLVEAQIEKRGHPAHRGRRRRAAERRAAGPAAEPDAYVAGETRGEIGRATWRARVYIRGDDAVLKRKPRLRDER